jgi:hypothetical protein
MTIKELVRRRRSSAGQAAVVGVTRALEMAFPIIENEAGLNRIGRALAALVALDAVAERVVAVEAA